MSRIIVRKTSIIFFFNVIFSLPVKHASISQIRLSIMRVHFINSLLRKEAIYFASMQGEAFHSFSHLRIEFTIQRFVIFNDTFSMNSRDFSGTFFRQLYILSYHINYHYCKVFLKRIFIEAFKLLANNTYIKVKKLPLYFQ